MRQSKRSSKSSILKSLRLACGSEREAVEFMEKWRWGADPACPRCGDAAVYQMRTKDGERNRDYRWRCRGCKKMFTVRTGTVLEQSKLPVRIWCYAIWRASASKKGYAALQLSRETEISYKSALFVMKRIREMMSTDPSTPRKLSGTVEVDETYVGGKPRYRAGVDPKTGKRQTGRGTTKTPVLAMVERGGEVRMSTLERITAPALLPAIWEAVDQGRTTIVTDELGAYNGVDRRVSGGHKTIRHKDRHYVDGDVHTNTVEGVFSLLKRGLIGTYHSMSKAHLPRYLHEFEFRYNTRQLDDGERVVAAIRQGEGKRLTYADSVIRKTGSA